jgi:hypothetical protein
LGDDQTAFAQEAADSFGEMIEIEIVRGKLADYFATHALRNRSANGKRSL